VIYSIDKNNVLTITVDLSKDFGRSKSGKTIIIATTSGGKELEGASGAYLGLNLYKYPDRN
jgi:hypothetical protein